MVIGLICIVLASVTFGISPVFSTEIMASGVDAQSMLFFSKLISLIAAGIVLLIRRENIRVTKKQLFQIVVFLGGGELLTMLMLVNSYRFLPIGLASMFHFIYPVFVTVAMIIFFKEKLTVLKIIAIVLALGGLALIIDLSGSMSFLGIVLALTSGLFYSMYVIANRKSVCKDLPMLVIVFYTTTTNFVCLSLYHLVAGTLVFPSSIRVVLLISANGLLCGLLGLLLLISAIRRIGASNAAICNMLEPLTALIAGAVIYSDRITLIALCGCILILLSITAIALGEKGLRLPKRTFAGK